MYFSLFIQDWERSGVLVLKCSDDGEHGEEENACSSSINDRPSINGSQLIKPLTIIQ